MMPTKQNKHVFTSILHGGLPFDDVLWGQITDSLEIISTFLWQIDLSYIKELQVYGLSA